MQNSHWLLCLVRFYLWMSRVKNHITFIGPDIFHLKLVSTSITQWYPGPVRQNKQNLSVRVPLERRPLSKVPPWARTSGVPSRNYLVSTIKNQTKWPIELWTLKQEMETDEDGKPTGARISKGRKMPHVDVICFCQNFDLYLFVCQLHFPNSFLFLLLFNN